MANDQPKREPGRPADYGEATPEDVAAAVLRHKPKPKNARSALTA